MTDPLFRFASAAVRSWTHLYTVGLPPAVRDRRRDEIDCDLWDFEADARHRGESPSGLHVLARLMAGIPDDLGWRMEQTLVRRIAGRSAVALAVIALMIGAATSQLLRPPDLPRVAPAPPPEILTLAKRAPPVPPPPPPAAGLNRR